MLPQLTISKIGQQQYSKYRAYEMSILCTKTLNLGGFQ